MNRTLETDNMIYEPWTNGYAVGFKCTDVRGQVSYIYLNPSSSDSDDGPNVFLYQGTAGDPGVDSPVEWFATDFCIEQETK